MRRLHVFAFLALLSASPLAPAQATASSGTVTRAPGAARTVQTIRTTATVVSIDPETRTVNLRRPDGRIVEIQVGDAVKNFGRIKVGDSVNVDYTEALSLELKKGGTGAPPHSDTQATTTSAPPGAQPRGTVGRRITVLADVLAVDGKKQLVTLRGPQGNLVELHVSDPEQLKRIATGDQVRAVYTEALAVAVEPAPGSRAQSAPAR